MSNPLNIALVGFGNVGTGVVRHFNDHLDMINSRLPRPLKLKTICSRNITRDRGVDVSGYTMTSDFNEVLSDDSIDIVVELIGGTEAAVDVVRAALKTGKHVVTANKALVAVNGSDIFEVGRENKAHLFMEAAVGAGIPLIRTFQCSLAPNRFDSLHGILNGTCNYILTAMEDTPGLEFEPILKKAMDLGYAEPDPTFDIEGTDAAHKIAIMGALAFGKDLRIDDVLCHGITKLSPADFEFAKDNGQTIKLLTKASLSADGTPELTVWPTLIPRDHLLGGVRGVTNTLWVEAEPVGGTMYAGPGAGQGSTGSGVIADLMLIAQAEGDFDRLDALNPLRYPDEKRLGSSKPTSHSERYLRLSGESAEKAAAALGYKVIRSAGNDQFLAAPAQSEDKRQAMFAQLAENGIDEKAACEIRVDLQQDGTDILNP